MLSWRVGGVFHPTPNSSVYAAYGISYNPSAEFGTLSSAPATPPARSLDRRRTRPIEVGAKADVLDGRLSLTGAVFRSRRPTCGSRSIRADGAAVIVLDGLARVDGFELGAAGKLTDKWQVFAGYSYLDSEIVKTTNLAERGQRAAEHAAAQLHALDHLRRHARMDGRRRRDLPVGRAFANTTNTAYVPEFWRFDAMASYKVTTNVDAAAQHLQHHRRVVLRAVLQGHAVPGLGPLCVADAIA